MSIIPVMNRALAISAIALVAVILGMSSLAPYVTATHDETHKKPIYREIGFCFANPPDLCTVVIDTNRNGECDRGDQRVDVPKKVWRTAALCPQGGGEK